MATPTLSQDFVKRISFMLQEEEVDIYTLMLFCMSTDDMNYFNESDRADVLKIFKILKEDTKRHMELLKSVLELGAS